MKNKRWPLHPHPFAEETLLSWLARIANGYKFSLDDLLQHDLGFQGKPDTLNMEVPDWLLTLLSERTGISAQEIYAHTLLSLTPLMLDNLYEKEANFESYVRDYSILLPSDVSHNYMPNKPWRPWFNEQSLTMINACPVCVDNNGTSIILLPWYLPIMLSCIVHQCLLRPCRIYQGCYIYWEDENATPTPSSTAIHEMDKKTWSALTTGQVTLPQRVVHAGVWFRLLRTLLDELHVPPPSSKKPYAKYIRDIWASHGLPPRAEQKNWRPYETLSREVQKQTLIAAATAITRMEHDLIKPPGEQVFLFFPEPIHNKDLPSFLQKQDANTIETPISPWQRANESMSQLIEMAKKDPKAAKDLRDFCIFGRTDLKVIQFVENTMIEAGVPSDFLAS